MDPTVVITDMSRDKLSLPEMLAEVQFSIKIQCL